MASFSAALESNDAKLRSLALEQHGSFQYLTGDMHGSLESLRWVSIPSSSVLLYSLSVEARQSRHHCQDRKEPRHIRV